MNKDPSCSLRQTPAPEVPVPGGDRHHDNNNINQPLKLYPNQVDDVWDPLPFAGALSMST